MELSVYERNYLVQSIQRRRALKRQVTKFTGLQNLNYRNDSTRTMNSELGF